MQRKRIAVITARVDDREQRMLLNGIAETAFSVNADVAVFSNVYNHWSKDAFLNFENHIYDFFQPAHFDGVIITAEAFVDLSLLEEVLERIRQAGLPAVIIGGEAEGFLSVMSDDASDLALMAEHLIVAHGLTKIDILTGPPHMPASHTRVAGCRTAFQKHGIPFDERHVFYGNFWNDTGEQLAERYLSGELPLPQAVICTNDYMAYGLCDTLAAAGIPIPERVTVTGYDHADARVFYYPTLTTYQRDRWQMGAKSVSLLLAAEIPAAEPGKGFISGNTCSCGVSSAQLHEELRIARIRQHHTVMSSVAQFTSRLTLCRTLAEYTAVLQEYFYLLHGASALSLCLDKAWNGPEYEGEMFLCCDIGERAHTGGPEYFERDQLLPAFWEEREQPMLFFFSPLCFETRLFGYAVLHYNSPQCYDFSFRDWNKTVANTLEFLRMKNDIHYLKQCQRVSTLYDALTGFYHLHEFHKIIDEIPDDCFLQAVKLVFFDHSEYQYGENYRSEIISTAAAAIRDSCEKHMVCCRADESLFFILCKKGAGGIFSHRLAVMLHHVFCGNADDDRVRVICESHTGIVTQEAIHTLRQRIEQQAAEINERFQERKETPHFRTLLQLRSRMQENPDQACATEEICKKLCISEGYFRVIYKKYFGISYVQDCIHARAMLACYLLLTTAMSVYAVSVKCGYSDEKFFSRQFHSVIGCSPIRYRERYLRKPM